MSYIPLPYNTETSIEEYMQSEFQRIAKELAAREALLNLPLRNTVPEKPREGDIVAADGVNWNPGAANGVYQYLQGVWGPLNGSRTGLFYNTIVSPFVDTQISFPLVPRGIILMATDNVGNVSIGLADTINNLSLNESPTFYQSFNTGAVFLWNTAGTASITGTASFTTTGVTITWTTTGGWATSFELLALVIG